MLPEYSLTELLAWLSNQLGNYQAEQMKLAVSQFHLTFLFSVLNYVSRFVKKILPIGNVLTCDSS